MKLLRTLTEGLTMRQEEGGRKVIDYHDDKKPDDPFFQKQEIKKKNKKGKVVTTTRIASSKPATAHGKKKDKEKEDLSGDQSSQHWINLLKDNVSTAEIDELESHNNTKPGAYQKSGMDKYTAMPVSSFQEFLDAMKHRTPEKIVMADGALERLSIRGAKSTASALSKALGQFRFYKHIVIIPLPSSHHLAKMYTNHVAEELRKNHSDVQVVETLLTKSNSPKIGSHLRGGKKKDEQDRGRMFSDRPTEYYKASHDLIMKHYSPEELDKYYKTRVDTIAHLITKLKSGPQTKHTAIQIKGLEEERIHFKALDEKLMDKVTGPVDKKKKHMKISNINAEHKRLTYDRFHADEKEMPKRKGNTLVILTDDNIHSDSSMIDAYRVLFKKGIVDSTYDKVVALALHRMGVTK